VITRKLEQGVELLIRDDGCGAEQDETELLRGGIGLSNVKKRLELLYGTAAELKIETQAAKGFTVRILIPIEQES
jgi:sensor histidine kinase YesM